MLRSLTPLAQQMAPAPILITFNRATLTEKGQDMLADMEANPPKDLNRRAKAAYS